jgi:serine/threonine protein phosphatase PrpC
MMATGDTHAGKARKYNDDAFGVFWHLGILLVADGVGSRPAGDVAARMAVDTVQEFFETDEITWPSDVPGNATEPRARLVAGITLANERIRKAASQSATLDRMATTLAGVVAAEDRLWIGHVGDSRCYRLRERRLELLTTDHRLDSDPEGRSRFPAEVIARSRPTRAGSRSTIWARASRIGVGLSRTRTSTSNASSARSSRSAAKSSCEAQRGMSLRVLSSAIVAEGERSQWRE